MSEPIISTQVESAEDIKTRPEKVRLTVQVSPAVGYRWATEDDDDGVSGSPIVPIRNDEVLNPGEYVAVITIGNHRFAATAEDLVGAGMELRIDEEDAEEDTGNEEDDD